MFNEKKYGLITYFTSPILDSYGIPHFFASRRGGVSAGDFESLNVSPVRKDSRGYTDLPENIYENYRRALEIIGVTPQNACTTKQVHSDIVKTVCESDAGVGVMPYRQVFEDCDGLVLERGTKNVGAVCVKTADCVPILLANVKTGAVAAVHAGWRGTVGDIVTRAVEKLGANPCDVVAAIGPCIGKCCYEVGNEVYLAAKRLFEAKGIEADRLDTAFSSRAACSADTAKHADLALINKLLLESDGVCESNIDLSGLCTCCTKDALGELVFFSHRAMGGHSGTFVSAIKTF